VAFDALRINTERGYKFYHLPDVDPT
jgi:hypothetical protein